MCKQSNFPSWKLIVHKSAQKSNYSVDLSMHSTKINKDRLNCLMLDYRQNRKWHWTKLKNMFRNWPNDTYFVGNQRAQSNEKIPDAVGYANKVIGCQSLMYMSRCQRGVTRRNCTFYVFFSPGFPHFFYFLLKNLKFEKEGNSS